MSILGILNTGLALMGWLFIMFKTGQWFISVALKQWDKRRRLSRRQKAVMNFTMRLTCPASNQEQPCALQPKAI